MIGLLDCNNFYVSCERLFRPDLQSKPVVVLSNNDGCVISRSNEVKALGIPMGAPLFQVQDLLSAQQTSIFSSNFALYADLSARVMTTLSALAPRVEVYSIDEAFLDFSNISNIAQVAYQIRQQIAAWIGIPTCIGIAPTKTLAKVANHIAKKNSACHGVCILEDPLEIDQALRTFAIDDIWGIGRRIAARLKALGINTAYELKQLDPKWMRQTFTVVGERLVHELNGIPCLLLEPEAQARQSIQVSRSFSRPLTQFEEIREAVASYATRLAEKLRSHQLKTNTLVISVCTNRFQVRNRQYYNSILINLPTAVNDDGRLIQAAVQGVEAIYRNGFDYHKAGIMALDLMPITLTQLTLFDTQEERNAKAQHISRTIDKINQRYGRGTVHMAACGPRLSWKDRKTRKSPAYTTSWHQLPRVFAK
ncbi:Y-family DNA polymerase [Candidatus Odyssella thessalonicensis]|uniref:Y-family DNA polymerase n=1 Tax=Candidatus Odyssella thessalonicensis TaxID=84647 RepID=UPI000225AF82|nr:Y-family DNA polymerase [Candidatus Odyssella thessalonicensis]